MPAALILALAALLAPAPSKVWTSLFDGKTLNGWEPAGKARWVVEDGAIVGRQGEGGAAGDLFTTELYDSFEAEAEWSMNWPGNSGLWFKYQGPGTGCQADILDEPAEAGILSGSIYCIGKRFIAENRASMPGSVSDRMYNYFNGAAFTRPATDAIGSAPRSLNYRAPGIRSADMALGKQFAVNERMHGEFRLEMQNATNTPGSEPRAPPSEVPALASLAATVGPAAPGRCNSGPSSSSSNPTTGCMTGRRPSTGADAIPVSL